MATAIKGKNIVITGASSGIGRATALALAKAGANIIVAARRELELEEVSLQCQKLNVISYYYKTDVTVLDQMNNLFEFALEKLGSIDIWINNAGVGAVGEFTSTPMDVHERVIRTNLIGYMHGAYVSVPYFKNQGRGILINNISIGAYVPEPFATAYSASKFGLRGFSEALRSELGSFKEIHVCDVFPAFIDTPGFQHAANFSGKTVKPVPPVYRPEKVAEAIVSLCETPRDKIVVGSSGRVAKVIHNVTPKLLGQAMSKFLQAYMKGESENVKPTRGSLFRPSRKGAGISGGWKKLHPLTRLSKR